VACSRVNFTFTFTAIIRRTIRRRVENVKQKQYFSVTGDHRTEKLFTLFWPLLMLQGTVVHNVLSDFTFSTAVFPNRSQ